MLARLNLVCAPLILIAHFTAAMRLANRSVLDSFVKNTPNENFTENFAMCWTSSWATSLFFFCLVICCVDLRIFANKLHIYGFGVLALALYFEGISEFALPACPLTAHNETLPERTNLLSNSFNRLHPPLLYFGSACVLTNAPAPKSSMLRHELRLKTKFFYGCVGLAVALTSQAVLVGSWWAVQEHSWGGWWNWDSSEILSVGPVSSALLALHIKRKNEAPWRLEFLNKKITWVTVVMYCAVQMNFAQTSHNFGLKFFFLFGNAVFLPGVLALHTARIAIANSRASRASSLFFFIKRQETHFTFFSWDGYVYVVLALLMTFKCLLIGFNFEIWAEWGDRNAGIAPVLQIEVYLLLFAISAIPLKIQKLRIDPHAALALLVVVLEMDLVLTEREHLALNWNLPRVYASKSDGNGLNALVEGSYAAHDGVVFSFGRHESLVEIMNLFSQATFTTKESQVFSSVFKHFDRQAHGSLLNESVGLSSFAVALTWLSLSLLFRTFRTSNPGNRM